MDMIEGIFSAYLLANDTVQMQFAPNITGTAGKTRPLLAKDIHSAELDFVSTFGFTPDKVREKITELLDKKHIQVTITIDEAKLSALGYSRSTTV